MLSLYFICQHLIFIQYSKKPNCNRSLTLEETEFQLLTYNYKVKQNIIGALTSEAVNAEPIPPLQMFRRHFMAAPTVRLSFCPISKSMSTILMNIFCYLYDPVGFVNANQSIPTGIWDKRFCFRMNEYNSLEEMQNEIGNVFYNTIAVIRDPLSRFISGFLDKCVSEGRRCFQCNRGNVSCVLTRLENELKQKPGVIEYGNKRFVYELLHMAPQTWYCEMKNIFKNTIYVKFGTGTDHDRMVKDLTIALNITKVPLEQINYIEKELRREERVGHSTEKSNSRNVTHKIIMTDEKMKKTFWNIFKNDYKIFEFSFPN